jgi:hypothetical protein
MSLQAIASSLRSRRFWIWQLGGVIIYAIPVTIRLATGNVVLPLLGLLEIPWIDHFVPGNLVEKILVNAFFPGAAGAVAGEIFFSVRNSGQLVSRRRKYGYRLAGAMVWVTAWSLFQLFGYMANVIGSYGGNLFEYPGVYPLNYLLASLSIFTPDVVSFLKNKICKILRSSRAPIKHSRILQEPLVQVHLERLFAPHYLLFYVCTAQAHYMAFDSKNQVLRHK